MFNVRIEPSKRLRRAVQSNDALLVRRIVKSHPDLIHNPDHSATGVSNSSLHLAASLGHLQVCKTLVALGHELPTPALNDDHQTALMLAASAGHIEVVLFLAENDPTSILRRDIRGRDAIMEASMGGHDTVLQILLTYAPGGAQSAVQNADLDGNTALHFASSNGNLLVLRTLLAAGADPEKRNVWSWTAIAYSATVQAEVYLKSLVSEAEKRKRVRNEADESSKGGAVRIVDQEAIVVELPYPATKLIIGQHLWVHPSRHSWAWLIVGSFYDAEDYEIWHLELFLGCRNTTVSDSVEASTTDSSGISVLNDSDNEDPNTTTVNDDTEVSHPSHQRAAFEYSSNIWSHSNVTYVPCNWTYPPAMATQTFGQGWNPQFGWDPSANAGHGNAFSGAVPMAAGAGGAAFFMNQGHNNQGPAYVIPQNGYNYPVPVFPGQPTRLPNPHPVVNSDAPALNLANSTGGVGCEPGYNYFFASEHTKLHVIKSSTAPWRLPDGMSMHFGAYHVPVNTTLAELMEGFGATNPFPRKNRVTEIIQGGNGKWYKGVTFSGESVDKVGKTLKDLGWDRSRTGRPGEKPVTWLWITKD
ncbi:hypothetical protein AAE478_009908 [Parahypoxylon ruwenzoriense]